jgi:hypothetical protein
VPWVEESSTCGSIVGSWACRVAITQSEKPGQGQSHDHNGHREEGESSHPYLASGRT